MIEWIKFKGSTEEERIQEISNYENIICFCDEGIWTFSTKESTRSILINRFTHWAPLNLPQEEKWERKVQFEQHSFNVEFDNIYSILNELRKR